MTDEHWVAHTHYYGKKYACYFFGVDRQKSIGEWIEDIQRCNPSNHREFRSNFDVKKFADKDSAIDFRDKFLGGKYGN
jgi:hypothetical protein